LTADVRFVVKAKVPDAMYVPAVCYWMWQKMMYMVFLVVTGRL